MSAKPLFNLENPTRIKLTEGTVTETETVILPYETEYVTMPIVTPMKKSLQKGEAE